MHLLFHVKFKYQVDNLKELRKQYKDLLKEAKGPVLVCTNHLTLIDSIIQGVILSSIPNYLLHFRRLPWNLPEKKNFYHKLHWRMVCYLGKCIPVTRKASPKQAKESTDKMLYILNRGDLISIFPEGKRSRTGIVDDEDFSYGTGQLLKSLPNTKVLCIYMRGIKNGGFANFPSKGERFHLSMKMTTPTSELKGLRKVRDLSIQVISEIKKMEEEYFEHEVSSRK
ncbi:hypothetical protein A9Q84_06820 [Halobacteriovorax marinus]|uniref:Phospholipid/glycerol acyltransferase domain-containing protein n=1 Tax=Halobacteriovorax marinus TaxID=97084 RepID=A0A1Y5FFH8_9BACT|nr:hypothetical protein A9Q84_06820 [Halobacteriovorax marinus]